MVIFNMRNARPAYNLIENNCQTFATALLDAIKIGTHREFATSYAVWKRAVGAGTIVDLFKDTAPEQLPEEKPQGWIPMRDITTSLGRAIENISYDAVDIVFCDRSRTYSPSMSSWLDHITIRSFSKSLPSIFSRLLNSSSTSHLESKYLPDNQSLRSLTSQTMNPPASSGLSINPAQSISRFNDSLLNLLSSHPLPSGKFPAAIWVNTPPGCSAKALTPFL
jgi:hypothetical protein